MAVQCADASDSLQSRIPVEAVREWTSGRHYRPAGGAGAVSGIIVAPVENDGARAGVTKYCGSAFEYLERMG